MLYYNKSVWEKAFDHDTAMQMILNGECGAFNPLLLECLTEVGSRAARHDEGSPLYRAFDAAAHRRRAALAPCLPLLVVERRTAQLLHRRGRTG